jgi:hypothetical protein
MSCIFVFILTTLCLLAFVFGQVHMLNAVKYLSSILTTFLNLLATTTGLPGLLVLWAIFAFGSSGFNCWWDLKKDWGLLDPESSVWLLRKNIVFPPVVYYCAIAVNVVLRVTWIVTISPSSFGINLQPPFITMFIGSIEIYRRFQWNILRMENEFANNCDNFRVTKEIPLPGKQRSLFATRDAGCCYGICDDKVEVEPTLSHSPSVGRLTKGKGSVSAPSIAHLLTGRSSPTRVTTVATITEEEAESINTFELPPHVESPETPTLSAKSADAIPPSIALTVSEVYEESGARPMHIRPLTAEQVLHKIQ